MTVRRSRPAGWWYPWIFVGCMLLVVAVNGVLVYFALSTWTGLETRDHYNKGLAYNENLAAARMQVERGWQMRVAFTTDPDAGGDRAGHLAVTFADRDGQPVEGLRVAAALIRPTHEGYDLDVPLRATGAGVYAGPVALPLPGLWDARVMARRGDATFQAVQRLNVR